MASKKTQPSATPVSESNPVTRFINYANDARAELRKVSWPTFTETRKATIVVLIFVTVMSILLGLVDLGLSSLVKSILS